MNFLIDKFCHCTLKSENTTIVISGYVDKVLVQYPLQELLITSASKWNKPSKGVSHQAKVNGKQHHLSLSNEYQYHFLSRLGLYRILLEIEYGIRL